MVPNGDGTYGVVAESQAIVAPVSVAGTGITIDIAGPIGFRTTATGKPGDPRNGVVYTGTPVHHGEPGRRSRCCRSACRTCWARAASTCPSRRC